jgi:transcription initiation factor TFIID subunit 2
MSFKACCSSYSTPKERWQGDGSDDNGEVATTLDSRTGLESPLLWLRVDPEMEYLVDIQIHQHVQMWISQLEKEKDVVAQLKAIATLCSFLRLSFSIVNALNNCLIDPKVF